MQAFEKEENSKKGSICIKRMGELDPRPFLEVLKQGDDESPEITASVLCSSWTERLADPSWHPFKIIKDPEGKEQV